MIDIITYCKDTNALVAEVQEKFPNKLAELTNNILIDKSQVIKNANGETMALVRCDGIQLEMIESLNSLVILGSYEEIFNTPEKKEIYDRVYVRKEESYDEIDPEDSSKTITKKYMPPERFALFAGSY